MTKKTQKKLRKALLLISCAALLVCITVGVTVAYLTDSANVKNTFTVGNVQITLDETIPTYDEVKNEWVATNDRTTETKNTNTYKILPGTKVAKDPTVTVIGGSEEAYIRMLVTVANVDTLKAAFPNNEGADGTFLLQNFVDWDKTNWLFEGATTEGTTTVYEFRYATTVEVTADTKLAPLFTTVTIPTTATGDDLAKLPENGLVIDVVAQAIQADGFTTDDLAWAAWE